MKFFIVVANVISDRLRDTMYGKTLFFIALFSAYEALPTNISIAEQPQLYAATDVEIDMTVVGFIFKSAVSLSQRKPLCGKPIEVLELFVNIYNWLKEVHK